MKKLSFVKYLFAAVGLIMLTAAAFFYIDTQHFLSSADSADGTVIRLQRKWSSDDSPVYNPVVHFYTANGKAIEFTSSVGSNPPSFSTGERVEVLYLANAPYNAKINTFATLWLGTIIFSVLGCIFSLVGLALILVTGGKRKLASRLKKEGIPVNARYVGVRLNNSISFNGKSPYQLLAKWQDPATSQEHVFNSENLWFDPSGQIEDEEITVLIEKDNPKKYYLDTSFLINPATSSL